MDKKKTLIISISSVAMFVILVIVASYAFFSTSVIIDNPENSTTNVSSAKISATFTDGPLINLTNIIPGDKLEKTFTLKNTGNVDIKYKIVIKEIENSFTNKSDIEVIVKENDNLIKTTIFPSATSAISDELTISPEETNSYTITITYKNTEADQSADMNSKIKGKIFIEEV